MTKRIYLLSRIKKYRSEIRRYKKEYRNRLSELAKKNSMKDKKILISVSQKAKEFIIEIKDNAGGIKEDILNNIFDEPYSTTKFKTKDVGFNLHEY